MKDFGNVVDKIESKEFVPPPSTELETKVLGKKIQTLLNMFVTIVMDAFLVLLLNPILLKKKQVEEVRRKALLRFLNKLKK